MLDLFFFKHFQGEIIPKLNSFYLMESMDIKINFFHGQNQCQRELPLFIVIKNRYNWKSRRI
jgi:hypothetical protein